MKEETPMNCGHLIQLAILTLLCFALFFIAPYPIYLAVVFPLIAFFCFFLLELYFLISKDEP